VDNRRWMTGAVSRQMDQERRMKINLLSYMKLRSYNRARICRHTVFQRHGSTAYDAKHYSEHYSEHNSEIPDHAPTCPSSNAEYDPKLDPESQLQCRYCTSRTRLIFGRATIFKEGDDSAGIATTPTTYNYRTGSLERSTVKRIHQLRRLAAAGAHGEEATIVLRERRKVHAGK
jgi:hypothetical protein